MKCECVGKPFCGGKSRKIWYITFDQVRMEPMDIVGRTKEDASLPKATMTKIIKEMLPPDVRVARDTQDLLIKCCVEFINLVSSESNEVCNKEEKRTIAPEHVIKALEVLGFAEYTDEVCAAYEQHRLETMDTMRSGKWSNGAEMTEEEALAEQQRMFAEARARMNGGASEPK
ncbi:protein Dr1 homolog isoform X3 [Andrographis paniculata]|uniref:protein Dr1 homolog isoform X3 n=1 Tax=Andrographis paniculata TaxID=175694 RepID=UPI0021E7F7DF|nr:protein Dr1 homolog isoform X3 [Andrographis paniculata]XP_051149844.1 protein Dr1 homolog isoform X3 [Andrographis paniculata]XP_051149845.1 protein Dr1 homolog isoform X3 [Andrographis paniculata]